MSNWLFSYFELCSIAGILFSIWIITNAFVEDYFKGGSK